MKDDLPIFIILEASALRSALEGEIDQLVYQLYGLTEEEVKIVKGEK